MTAVDNPGAFLRQFWLAAILVGYAGVRLVAVPDESTVGGFSHDSAYIALLAENLLDGKGYVNDSLWLPFLDPPTLPLPFHNSNPLYPTLIAGLSWITGKSVIWSGFALAAVSHAALIGILVLLLQPWVAKLSTRTLLATLAAFFPTIFESSLAFLPDLPGLVFVLAALACLVRIANPYGSVLAGVLMGLAWLTRSSEMLALPMIAVYLVLRDSWRGALPRLAIFGTAFLVVVAPWLIHTAKVWGSPFRSDSTYYWLQDYYARAHDGSVARFWHSVEQPPSLRTVLNREPVAFLSFYAGSMALFIRRVVAAWSDGRLWLAVVLSLLGFEAAIRLLPRLRTQSDRLPPVVALLVLAATLWLVLAPRAPSFEVRYISLLSVAVALLLASVVLPPGRNWPAFTVGLGFWLVWVPWQDARLATRLSSPATESVAYARLAQIMNDSHAHGDAVVVGDRPYAYTLATSSPALSILERDDAHLLTYMEKYHAQFVLLTPQELAFWRPGWSAGAIPSGLMRRPDLADGGGIVFERKAEP